MKQLNSTKKYTQREYATVVKEMLEAYKPQTNDDKETLRAVNQWLDKMIAKRTIDEDKRKDMRKQREEKKQEFSNLYKEQIVSFIKESGVNGVFTDEIVSHLISTNDDIADMIGCKKETLNTNLVFKVGELLTKMRKDNEVIKVQKFVEENGNEKEKTAYIILG